MTMQSPYAPPAPLHDHSHTHESNISGVSWGAVIAGGFAAMAVSVVLVILGSGLGLSAFSPSSQASAFPMKAALWIVFTQWIASGFGGYIAGRLRTKWVQIHDDEIMFRDSAHGFLAWSLATVVAAFLTFSVATMIVGGGLKAATPVVAAGAAGSAHEMAKPGARFNAGDGYYVDLLVRPSATTNAAPVNAQDSNAEITRILWQGAKNGGVSDDDKAYLAKVVAARTGISDQEANDRVNTTLQKINDDKETAKQKAEAARKASMHMAFYMAFALAIGAFIASIASVLGGRLRDEYHAEYHAAKRVV